MPVSRLTVICKAGQLKLAFNKKTLSARKMCMSCFLLKNNLVQRIAAHTAQRPPEQVNKDAHEFIPAGCTGLVQPINIGFNKPFKSNMKRVYTHWLRARIPTLLSAVQVVRRYLHGSLRPLEKSVTSQSETRGARQDTVTSSKECAPTDDDDNRSYCLFVKIGVFMCLIHLLDLCA